MPANLLLFTEVDVPADRLGVTSARVTTTDGDRDEAYYLYYDFGVDGLSMDFNETFQALQDGGAGSGDLTNPWAKMDIIGTRQDLINDKTNNPGIVVHLQSTGVAGVVRIILSSFASTNANDLVDLAGVNATKLHYRIIGDSAGGAFGQVDLEIYVDDTEAVLLATLTVQHAVAMGAKRYFYPTVARDDGISGVTCNGYSENYEGLPAIAAGGRRRKILLQEAA